MGDVKRYMMDENSLMGGVDMFEDDNGEYVHHSDYATLLARHNALVERFTEMHQSVEYSEMALYERTLGYNALVEAVAWESECCALWWQVMRDNVNLVAMREINATQRAARAEVDRLIADCKGEG